MPVLVITGTGTEVGKTVVTAAVAATALAGGRSVAVLKAAQTGVGADEAGDAAEVARLAGEVTVAEVAGAGAGEGERAMRDYLLLETRRTLRDPGFVVG
ncbi:AAA family ATPase, partial [Streptomyces tendae]|uniref:AAA family ATPase n=1 Tax=Streptomyces tendae TaxID=1932 RepID=UPI0033B9DB48